MYIHNGYSTFELPTSGNIINNSYLITLKSENESAKNFYKSILENIGLNITEFGDIPAVIKTNITQSYTQSDLKELIVPNGNFSFLRDYTLDNSSITNATEICSIFKTNPYVEDCEPERTGGV
jgi:hypothetical protein